MFSYVWFTSRYPLCLMPPPATPWRLPTSAWPRRVILSRGKARQFNLSAQRRDTSRPVVPFVALTMRWRTTSAALPSCGAARDGVQKVRPPRLSPRSAAARRQVLTCQFDASTSGHRQGECCRTAQAPLRIPPRLTPASRRPSQPVCCWSADCLTALSSVAIAPL